jgi:hypothetical protein
MRGTRRACNAEMWWQYLSSLKIRLRVNITCTFLRIMNSGHKPDIFVRCTGFGWLHACITVDEPADHINNVFTNHYVRYIKIPCIDGCVVLIWQTGSKIHDRLKSCCWGFTNKLCFGYTPFFVDKRLFVNLRFIVNTVMH